MQNMPLVTPLNTSTNAKQFVRACQVNSQERKHAGRETVEIHQTAKGLLDPLAKCAKFCLQQTLQKVDEGPSVSESIVLTRGFGDSLFSDKYPALKMNRCSGGPDLQSVR